MHTEKSEFPSDPFRYNRDVSNYSFDIVPINVRDEDGRESEKNASAHCPTKGSPHPCPCIFHPDSSPVGPSRLFNRAVYDDNGC